MVNTRKFLSKIIDRSCSFELDMMAHTYNLSTWRQRQEVCHKFKANLVYIVSLKPVRAT